MGNRVYSNYMRSQAWRDKKEQYWTNHNVTRVCYKCGARRKRSKKGYKWGLQLHHRTYQNFGNEELKDLVPLCLACHRDLTNAWKNEKSKPYDIRLTLWEFTDKFCEKGKYKKKGK